MPSLACRVPPDRPGRPHPLCASTDPGHPLVPGAPRPGDPTSCDRHQRTALRSRAGASRRRSSNAQRRPVADQRRTVALGSGLLQLSPACGSHIPAPRYVVVRTVPVHVDEHAETRPRPVQARQRRVSAAGSRRTVAHPSPIIYHHHGTLQRPGWLRVPDRPARRL